MRRYIKLLIFTMQCYLKTKNTSFVYSRKQTDDSTYNNTMIESLVRWWYV